MSEIWFISDTHFDHKNIIEYANRPFKSVEEMNEAIIANCNSVMSKRDTLIHVGDVCFSKNVHIHMNRIKGNKILVLGNHDDLGNENLRKCFNEITLWKKYKNFGLLITHVPVYGGMFDDEEIRTDGRRKKISLNVHGHLHEKVVCDKNGKRHPNYLNVGVERINYTPIHIAEVLKKIKD